MVNWKKILLWAVGIGAGFALTTALIIGGFMWWSSRPPKPKPWNQNAITATYDNLGTEGEKNNFWFAYTLENHTNEDYRIDSESPEVHLAVLLRRSNNALSFGDNKDITTDYPVFIPAKKSVRFQVRITYPYTDKEDYSAPDDVRHDWETKAAIYLTKELNNVNGFALIDERTRYEINMPNGWDARAKEQLRVKK
jgi:hypothetical protein